MPLAENSADYVHGIQRLWRTGGETIQVYHNDRLGSAERLTDLAGATIGSVRYGEWGVPSVTSPGLNPSYTGHEYDPALGIHFAKARFHDPLDSRMLSEDPVRGRMLELPGGQRAPMLPSLNLYAYCGGNPLAFVDPTGLDAVSIRKFMKDHFGSTAWDELNRIAAFTANGKTLVTGAGAGSKDGMEYWNENDYMTADEADLITCFFGAPKCDQRKGTKVVFRNGTCCRDATEPVQTAVLAAESTFKEHSFNFLWFKDQVDNDAPWDIKIEERWKNTIGTEYPGKHNANVIYGGGILTPEKLGNITYGYLGRAAGFTESALILGSVYANGIMGYITATESGRFNENNDHAYIRIGIDWYEQCHVNMFTLFNCCL
jgi:RHS repeat-associated protein